MNEKDKKLRSFYIICDKILKQNTGIKYMKTKFTEQNKEVILKFKEILDECNINYEKVFLFGSRARGKYDKDSDWDFYIVTRDSLDNKSKKNLSATIRVKFHEYYPFKPLDIIINDKDTFNNRKSIVNTIANEALIEGIRI